MNWYEEKQERRRERLEARAEKLSREARAKIDSGMERLRAIPFGQPILVGHYSERRDRNYRAKAGASIDKGMALQKAAGDAAARAASVGSGGISSDDPEAVVKLKERLAELEAKQEAMKAANAEWRKAGNKSGRQPDGSWVDKPYTYELTNNNGNMARIKQRIAQLEKNATRETKVEEMQGVVKLVQNTDINRMQMIFPGKPDASVRTILKSRGFRWSPSEGAWQRQLNTSAIWAAEDIAKSLTEKNDANV